MSNRGFIALGGLALGPLVISHGLGGVAGGVVPVRGCANALDTYLDTAITMSSTTDCAHATDAPLDSALGADAPAWLAVAADVALDTATASDAPLDTATPSDEAC